MEKALNNKDWQKKVCQQAWYQCQACWRNYNSSCYFNELGQNTAVCWHHVLSKGSHTELRLYVDIWMCVDHNCHVEIHKGLRKVPDEIKEKAESVKQFYRVTK